MIDYQNILKNNMINVFKDILKNIKANGLKNGNHLYVTFLTDTNKVKIPEWLKKKYPNEITIVLQHEFYDLEIKDNYFSVSLSFEDIIAKLKIHYDAIISFADPYSNFGMKLKENKPDIKENIKAKNHKSEKKDNIIQFSNNKKKLS